MRVKWQPYLQDFGALIVDLGIGGGEEGEEEEGQDEHEHPVQGGGVGQPVHHPDQENVDILLQAADSSQFYLSSSDTWLLIDPDPERDPDRIRIRNPATQFKLGLVLSNF